MNWIDLNKECPVDQKFVLGCDWYPDNSEEGNFRMHVCEGEAEEGYWCGEKDGRKVLNVAGSICPKIGHGLSAYWMPMPKLNDGRWIRFDEENPPKFDKLTEVLIKMYNGNYYIGFIESFDWCPSFNMFKHGHLESIECYMQLPEKPNFIAPEPLSEEEELRRDALQKKWEIELDESYAKSQENGGFMRFKRFEETK